MSKVLLFVVALATLLAVLAWLMPAAQRTALLGALPVLRGKIIESQSAQPQSKVADGGDDAQTPPRVVLVDGAPALKLTAGEQRRSGIRTALLKQITYRAESVAYGEIVDIQSLLKLRAQYDVAHAEQEVTASRLQVSVQEYKRLRELNGNGNIISAGRMREAQARWEIDQARIAAARTRVQNIRALAIQVWGKELTAQALDDESERMRRLIDRDDVLLRITLAPSQSMALATHTAFIDRNGDRRHAREASLISAAPSTDSAAQGETWFFRTNVDGLRTGMRVVAWLPKAVVPIKGVLLPASAAVWYGGKPWVYISPRADLFVRRAVLADNEVPGGWLANDGFNAGEAVVVSGGQMLLSEEFREQIPEENED